MQPLARSLFLLVVLLGAGAANGLLAQEKPNILVIWGDDVGVHNISAYNHGIMGYQTPSIDSIARDGAMFTDAYAQQSCGPHDAIVEFLQGEFGETRIGVGLSGTSGSGEPPQWRQQTADLSPYIPAGEIWLRFEYVTDDAVYEQGFAVDDIVIPQLNYEYDAETGDDGWTAVGFVRHTNELPQTFISQLILFHDDGSFSVEPLPLDEQQHGRWTIPLSADTSEAIWAISGSVPATTLPATYRYTVTAGVLVAQQTQCPIGLQHVIHLP